MRQVKHVASRAVWFVHEQRLLMADHLAHLLPLPVRRAASLLVLEPLLWLGGHSTHTMLRSAGGIEVLSGFSITATKATLLVSPGTLLGFAMAAGLGLGVMTLVLSQRVHTDLLNVQLLWQDLCRLPRLLWGWQWFAALSSAQSRLAYDDARMSFGAALGLPCAPGSDVWTSSLFSAQLVAFE